MEEMLVQVISHEGTYHFDSNKTSIRRFYGLCIYFIHPSVLHVKIAIHNRSLRSTFEFLVKNLISYLKMECLIGIRCRDFVMLAADMTNAHSIMVMKTGKIFDRLHN